jgi:hypothetical protein
MAVGEMALRWNYHDNPKTVRKVVLALLAAPDKQLGLKDLKAKTKIRDEDRLFDCLATLFDQKKLKFINTKGGQRFYQFITQDKALAFPKEEARDGRGARQVDVAERWQNIRRIV